MRVIWHWLFWITWASFYLLDFALKRARCYVWSIDPNARTCGSALTWFGNAWLILLFALVIVTIPVLREAGRKLRERNRSLPAR